MFKARQHFIPKRIIGGYNASRAPMPNVMGLVDNTANEELGDEFQLH